MSTEQTKQTKRERQKQRRDAKLAEQRRQAARARRNRMIAIGVIVAVVVAAIGAIVAGRLAAQRERDENIAAAEDRLGELGCTPIEEMPDLGGGHLAGTTEALTAAPPDTLYPDRPASSGQHIGTWVLSGVYDKQIDERLLVHNLEHGYANVYYGPEAPAEQVEALRTFAQESLDGDYPKMVVAPYGEPLPDGAQFAMVAWGFRQTCEQFDADVARAFLDQHHNGELAPERYLPPHTGDNGIDPNAQEGPLLFPPLGEQPQVETDLPEGASELPEGATERGGTEQPSAAESG